MDLQKKKNCLRLIQEDRVSMWSLEKCIDLFFLVTGLTKDDVYCMQECRKFFYLDITLKEEISVIEVFFTWKKNIVRSDYVIFCSDIGRQEDIVVSMDNPYVSVETILEFFQPYVVDIIFRRDYLNSRQIWDGRRRFSVWLQKGGELAVTNCFKIKQESGYWKYVEKRKNIKKWNEKEKKMELSDLRVQGKIETEAEQEVFEFIEISEPLEFSKLRFKRKKRRKEGSKKNWIPDLTNLEGGMENTKESVFKEIKLKNLYLKCKGIKIEGDKRTCKDIKTEGDKRKKKKKPINWITKNDDPRMLLEVCTVAWQKRCEARKIWQARNLAKRFFEEYPKTFPPPKWMEEKLKEEGAEWDFLVLYTSMCHRGFEDRIGIWEWCRKEGIGWKIR